MTRMGISAWTALLADTRTKYETSMSRPRLIERASGYGGDYPVRGRHYQVRHARKGQLTGRRTLQPQLPLDLGSQPFHQPLPVMRPLPPL